MIQQVYVNKDTQINPLNGLAVLQRSLELWVYNKHFIFISPVLLLERTPTKAQVWKEKERRHNKL